MKIDKAQLLVTVFVSFTTALLGTYVGHRFFMPPTPSYQAIDGAPSAAAARSDYPPVPASCEDDARRLACEYVSLAEGGPTGCLIEFEDQLSPDCKTTMKPHLERLGACEEDARKFCPGVKKGRKRIPNCLRAHAKEISSTCAKSLGL